MERSRYATQLSWWFEHFPREQFLLLQYEQCVRDPAGQFARTLEGEDAAISKEVEAGNQENLYDPRRMITSGPGFEKIEGHR